jgi:hypothetical protein
MMNTLDLKACVATLLVWGARDARLIGATALRAA